MKKLAPLGIMLVVAAVIASGAPPRFEKVSDHYYCYQCRSDALNVGAVVSDDGILLVNPPPEPELSEALDALKRVSPRPIRWVVATDYRIAMAGGAARLAEQGAILIGCDAMRPLLAATAENPQEKPKSAEPHNDAVRLSISFGHQMRLFPGGLEVRIFSPQTKARTAGDIVLLIPAERIVQLGDLYNLGSYPEIDEDQGRGSATGWIDGIKQIVDSVPLLKPAIPPPPKPGMGAKSAPPKPPLTTAKGTPGSPDKTLEEEVVIVTGRGARSNLMELKGLLETSQKLRAEVSKLAAAGVERDSFLSSPGLAAFRVYNGFDQYASQLFDVLSKK